MTDPELLKAAIAASGLSARKFATVVLLRDERTIRRWLRGPVEGSTNALPKVVREKCESIIGESG
jgi:hypothetical protein